MRRREVSSFSTAGWDAARGDVIHFNWGLHDLCYRNPNKGPGSKDKVNGVLSTSLAQYEANLERLVARLKRSGAALVWASTTPVPEGEPGRIAGDAARYNAVAARVMNAHGIAINDLHGHVAPKFAELATRPGDVHFKRAGSQVLAEKVVASIEAALGEN